MAELVAICKPGVVRNNDYKKKKLYDNVFGLLKGLNCKICGIRCNLFLDSLIYIVIGYFSIRLISKYISKLNVYVKLIITSFCNALFWGIGIAASGGDPGFGFPAPNIIAIGLIFSIGFYYGAITGLIILLFWWILIFMIMLIYHLTKMKYLQKMKSI